MACPYITGEYLQSCIAAPDVYVPSAFQLEEYCTGSWYTLCPLFRQRRYREGKPIRDEASLAVNSGGSRDRH